MATDKAGTWSFGESLLLDDYGAGEVVWGHDSGVLESNI
jgi:hypothetical protein